MKTRPVIPAGSSLPPSDDEDFERIAMAELERLPPDVWRKALKFWRLLPKAHPSTRRRLLAHAVDIVAKSGSALPSEIAKAVIAELGVSKAPRSRLRTEAQMRLAARYKAQNPDASLDELAKAAGIPGKRTTAKSYLERPEFKRFRADEFFLLELQTSKHAALVEMPTKPKQKGARQSVHRKSEC